MIAALVPIAVFVAVGSSAHVPFAALGPGPTVNTLGAVDGQDVVAIDGADLDETEGNLNMTTVEVRSSLTLFDALGYWASGRYGVVPIDEVIPQGQTQDEVRETNLADFQQSERNAERAALAFLQYPTAAQIDTVSEDGAAQGQLQAGDRVTTVDSVAVASAAEVIAQMEGKRPGDTVTIAYTRSEGEGPDAQRQEGEARITLKAHPEEPERGVLGVLVGTEPLVDFTVTFNLADVGGPSAGLMFALAVVDKLSPGELNGGRFVAGTGTIDAAGAVGPIGGIRYKLVAAQEAGATEFLVPSENCVEAARNAPDGLTLLRVDTLAEAVDSLAAVAAGEPAPTC